MYFNVVDSRACLSAGLPIPPLRQEKFKVQKSKCKIEVSFYFTDFQLETLTLQFSLLIFHLLHPPLIDIPIAYLVESILGQGEHALRNAMQIIAHRKKLIGGIKKNRG